VFHRGPQFCGWGSDTHQVCAAGTGSRVVEQSGFHFPPPWTVKIAPDKLRLTHADVHLVRCFCSILICRCCLFAKQCHERELINK
jgi:hypothetical protein